MADNLLDSMMEQISPDNRTWVKRLPKEKQREILKEWQDEGGNTDLGNVGTGQSNIDADAMVEKHRKG
jgi:flagellar hook assembly protein FlgD